MADTGFLFPGTAVGNRTIADSDDPDWSNPGNITADDTSKADWANVLNNDTSHGLAASNFDFSSIPAGAVIDGIEAQIGDYNGNSIGNAASWEVCKLILADDSDGSVSKHSVLIAPPTAPTEQTDEAGGASDLWSETIGISDVQDSDWGFFVGTKEVGGLDRTHEIDFMRMKVYYTPAPVITDVNTTESWTDGDTGLIITGTGFV